MAKDPYYISITKKLNIVTKTLPKIKGLTDINSEANIFSKFTHTL